MPPVRSSRSFSEAAKALASLSVSDFEALAKNLLAQENVSVRVSALYQNVLNETGDPEFSRAFCYQLTNLAAVRRVQQSPIEDVLDNYISEIGRRHPSDDLSKWYFEARETLLALLSSAAIRLPAKALHLSTDFVDVFISSNVLTDIRPVFDNERNKIEGAVITQTFRIHYFSSDGSTTERELALAVDLDDIEKLMKELQSAKEKAEIAKKEFEKILSSGVFISGEETYGFN